MQRLKVILVVVGLLLIGFTGGFLTNRHLVQQRVDTLRRLGEGRGFGELFLKRIDAPDEQANELRAVFEVYGPKFKELGAVHRQALMQLSDSLFQELTPLLTEEQIRESQKWRRMLVKSPRMKKMRGSKEHRPPKD